MSPEQVLGFVCEYQHQDQRAVSRRKVNHFEADKRGEIESYEEKSTSATIKSNK